jgi:hypothetical protein
MNFGFFALTPKPHIEIAQDFFFNKKVFLKKKKDFFCFDIFFTPNFFFAHQTVEGLSN